MGGIIKNNIPYCGFGTEVSANPSGVATATLEKLQVGDTVYGLLRSKVKLDDVSGETVVVTANEATFTWTDPNDKEIGGSVVATWSGTKLVRKLGSAPTSITDGTVVLDSKVRNQYSSTGYTDSNLGYDSVYYYRFFPYTTEDAVTDGATLIVTPTRTVIQNVPSQSGTLTYDGTQQTAVFSNFDSSQLTVTGNTGTNAGSYTAQFTPKNGYCWSDETTTAKSVTWSIGKATGSVSVSSSSVSLNTSTLYKDITITKIGDGALSVSSSNTSVATVGSITNNVFRISAQGNGSTTVTVSMAAGTNYTAASTTISVSISLVSATLNSNSWATISSVSAAGTASTYWQVGDCKEIVLNGKVGSTTYTNKSLCVFILGFDHNSSVEGSGISFGGFKTALTSGKDVCLNDSIYGRPSSSGSQFSNLNHWSTGASPTFSTNYGGWGGCDARYDVLGSTDKPPSDYGSALTTSRVGYNGSRKTATTPVSNTLMAALPSDLRAVMKPITKYTDNKGNKSKISANVTTTKDYLPLLAEWEVQGGGSYANTYEKNNQRQYQYYINGNSKIKYKQNNTSSGAIWWLRSAVNYSLREFCVVVENGGYGYSDSRFSYGLAPVFLV